ncbi:MAG: cytochrome B [Gammaproteobacteria bacterium]|nr:cytochrome B [Gammaproteobacteria bacterium]
MKVMIYKRFERFWHWTQAALIVALMITGFEIHAVYSLFGFERAVNLHIILAWSLIVLWAFAIFWHLTTGEWRHYIPTTEKLMAMVRYYSIGMFRDEEKPFKKSLSAKHNPLQRLAYLGFKLAISPLIWISGLLYLFYTDWPALGLEGLSLGTVAMVHTAAAIAMLVFFIAHVYLALTGRPFYAYVKAMITGYEEIEDAEASGKKP